MHHHVTARRPLVTVALFALLSSLALLSAPLSASSAAARTDLPALVVNATVQGVQSLRDPQARAAELGCVTMLHDNTQANNLEQQVDAVQS